MSFSDYYSWFTLPVDVTRNVYGVTAPAGSPSTLALAVYHAGVWRVGTFRGSDPDARWYLRRNGGKRRRLRPHSAFTAAPDDRLSLEYHGTQPGALTLVEYVDR